MTPKNWQSNPAATTDTELGVVTASKNARMTVFAAETNAVAATIRLALLPSGGTLATEHYLAYELALGANGKLELATVFMSAGDKLICRASTADVAFTATGYEQDA